MTDETTIPQRPTAPKPLEAIVDDDAPRVEWLRFEGFGKKYFTYRRFDSATDEPADDMNYASYLPKEAVKFDCDHIRIYDKRGHLCATVYSDPTRAVDNPQGKVQVMHLGDTCVVKFDAHSLPWTRIAIDVAICVAVIAVGVAVWQIFGKSTPSGPIVYKTVNISVGDVVADTAKHTVTPVNAVISEYDLSNDNDRSVMVAIDNDENVLRVNIIWDESLGSDCYKATLGQVVTITTGGGEKHLVKLADIPEVAEALKVDAKEVGKLVRADGYEAPQIDVAGFVTDKKRVYQALEPGIDNIEVLPMLYTIQDDSLLVEELLYRVSIDSIKARTPYWRQDYLNAFAPFGYTKAYRTVKSAVNRMR